MRNWVVYTVELDGKWAYIIDEPGSFLWDGYVSKPHYANQADAAAAGYEFLKVLHLHPGDPLLNR